jgi:hypothetical protein
MKIIKNAGIEQEFNRFYGCNNCIRQGGACYGNKRDCRLMLPIAFQMSEPEKIDNFVAVLQKLSMKVVIIGDGFRIVSV